MGTKFVENSEGILEEIDEATGQVISVQKPQKQIKPGKKRRINRWNKNQDLTLDDVHYVVDSAGRQRLVRKGTNPDYLPRDVFPYSQVTCDAIIELLIEGHTLMDICKRDGFPPRGVVYAWRTKYKEFDERCKKAKELRAEAFHDKAIYVAEESKKSTVHSDRLKVDTYRWAAEVGRPSEYGKQTKITGDPDAPVGFVISTGIERTQEPVQIDPSSEKKDE
jgi:hypothetical protein